MDPTISCIMIEARIKEDPLETQELEQSQLVPTRESILMQNTAYLIPPIH